MADPTPAELGQETWKAKILKVVKDPRVLPLEVWAVRAVLAYLVAKQAAPHSVP